MATGGVATTPKNVFGFDPRSVAGCVMWLDAADSSTLTGSPVTSVRDKVGGITLTKTGSGSITTTTINSVQALNFDGTTYLTGPVPSFFSGTAFIVWKASVAIGSTWSALITWVAVVNGSTINLPAFGYQGSTSGNTVGPYTTGVGNGSPTLAVTTGNTYMASYTWNGNRATVGINGAVPTTGSQPTPYTGVSPTILIATDYTAYLQTVIGEILLYSTMVSDEQRQQIEGYLAWKWGLNTSIPTTHPHYSLRPFGRIFQPIDIEKCQLWLDAADTSAVITSGTAVTAWIDKSGYGRTLYPATGSGTTTYVSYGPGYSVKLNNSYMYTFNPVDLTTYTVFIVALAQTAVDNQAVFSAMSGLVVTGAASYNSTDSFGFYMDSLASSRLDSRFYGSLLGNPAVNPATTVTDKIPLALYTYTVTANGVLTSWINGAPGVLPTTPMAAFTYSVTAISSTATTVTYTVSSTFGLFVNSIVVISGATSPVYNGIFYVSSLTGTTFTIINTTTGGATSTATATAPGSRTNTAAGFTIGGEYYSGGFSGVSLTSIANLYEILVYNRVLTTAERQRVEGYLLSKWSIPKTVNSNYTFSTQTFSANTGTVQTWTVPGGVYYVNVTLKGAGGYHGFNQSSGAAGALITGILSVTPGSVLNIYVGKTGATVTAYGQASAGGWPGGGSALAGEEGGGGGGYSAIANSAGTTYYVIAGGGGGGTGYGGSAGAGGIYGSTSVNVNGGTAATGGTQTAGGSAGSGSSAGSYLQGGNASSAVYSGGGGGGGYYGGGGGASGGPGAPLGGGGGGSSLVNAPGFTLLTGVTGGGSAANTNGSVVISYTFTHPYLNYPPTSIPAFNPGHIQGLDLWIDAASDTSATGTIASVPDRSKNAYSVVPYSTDSLSITRNYLNGYPSYNTTISSRYSVANFYWGSEYTTFLILKGANWLYSSLVPPGTGYFNYVDSPNWDLYYVNQAFSQIDGGFVVSWALSGAPLPTINSPTSITLPSPTNTSIAISVQKVAISSTRSTSFSFTVPATAGEYSYFQLYNGTTQLQYLLNAPNGGGAPFNIYLFFGTNAYITVGPGTVVRVDVTNTIVSTYINGTLNRTDSYTNSGSAPYTLQFYVLSNGTGGTTTYSNISFDNIYGRAPNQDVLIIAGAGSGNWNMLSLGYSSGSKTVKNYSINGIQRTTPAGAGTIMAPTPPQTIILNGNNGGAAGAGPFAEFLHYNISLTPEQRQKVEGYLSWKWGLQNNLPTYHPYYKFAPAATIPYVFSMNTFTAANFNLNGTATVTTSSLQLTPNIGAASSSAFYVNKVKITNFTTYFNMTFTNTNADGSTFCIQNYACNALSGGGGYLGYYPTMPTSVAITLKTYASSAFAGETGILSTDLLTNGTLPAAAGFSGNLNSTMSLTSNTTWNFGTTVSYDGSAISWKIVNLANLSTVSYSSTINISSIVGADYAWVGFTSGTGGATESCFVNYWNYNAF